MTLASKITLVRVAFIPAFMILMYQSGGESGLWMWLALGVFIIASLTDYVEILVGLHQGLQIDDAALGFLGGLDGAHLEGLGQASQMLLWASYLPPRDILRV